MGCKRFILTQIYQAFSVNTIKYVKYSVNSLRFIEKLPRVPRRAEGLLTRIQRADLKLNEYE